MSNLGMWTFGTMNVRSMLLFLVALPLVAAAQRSTDHHHRNYIRGGYHYSDLPGDADLDPLSGFYAGYHHTLLKVPLVGISLGAEYNTAGARQDTPLGALEYKLGYFGLPVNGRLKLGLFYLDAGLTPAFTVSERVQLGGQDVGGAPEAENFDLVVHAGGGVKIAMLAVEARYRYGLTDVYDGVRNSGLQLGVAWYLLWNASRRE